MDNYGASAPRRPLRFFIFLRRYWWVPVLTMLLGLAGAATYVRWAPPVFVSSTAMYETEKLHLQAGALTTDERDNYLGTQIELLKSDRLRQGAMARLQASGTNAIPLGEDGLPLDVLLSFKKAPKAAIFAITAGSADPAFSRNYLDALMLEYLEYKETVGKLDSGDTAASISTQVESSQGDLRNAQDALAAFQRTNNPAILAEQGTLAGGQLAKLQTELSDLKLESQLLEATPVPADPTASGDPNVSLDSASSVREFSSASNMPPSSGHSIQSAPPPEPGLDHTPIVFLADFGAQDLRKSSSASNMPANSDQFILLHEIERLESERAKLSFLATNHPRIVALDAQIARDAKAIETSRRQDIEQTRRQEREQSLEQSREQLRQNIKFNKIKMESVMASIKEWESKVIEANSRLAEVEHLKLNVTHTQSAYDGLKASLQNADVSRNTDLETLAVLEPASPAKRSYKEIIRAFLLAAMGGLVLGGGVIFLIERRDDRFTSVTEANATLGEAIVGLLPEVTHKGNDPIHLLEVDDPRHGYAESYRSLRSALLFLPAQGQRPKVLLVTSAVPNEGKSTVAANLSRTLALAGSNVVLVDADMRRGILHQLFGMQRTPGLAELLWQTDDLENILQRDSLTNLSFIPRGASLCNPGDYLSGPAFDRILTRLRQQFDYVVIDSSPLFAADDASCLAPKADGTLFVVRRGYSSARVVSEALDLLAQRQARVLGVIFNGADATAPSYHYYKYADYNISAKTA
jgi:polysaccharide biosynthesis transport protein